MPRLRSRLNLRICVFLLLGMASFLSIAHELSTSFIRASIDDTGRVSGELKLNVLDLKDAIKLDINTNGELTWGELQSSRPLIHNYIARNLSFQRNDHPCNLQLNMQHALQKDSRTTYLLIPFVAQCDTINALSLRYQLLFDIKANHKAIVSLTSQDNEHLAVVRTASTVTVFDVKSGNVLEAVYSFVYQGIYHILIGLDHILFLLTLLLTVSLTRKNKEWVGIDSKTSIIKRTFWIVTSFTLAHSITLSGTALAWLPQFGPWIEVVIAASILFNVVNNLFPLITRLSFITFAFGLIHGMGFAGALADLGLPENQKLLTVLAFNLGVELGQMVILCLCLPVLLYFRKSTKYQQWVMPITSVLIGGLAVYWIIERV